MKLKVYSVELAELQDWLDKYEDKIKFILTSSVLPASARLILIIDES